MINQICFMLTTNGRDNQYQDPKEYFSLFFDKPLKQHVAENPHLQSYTQEILDFVREERNKESHILDYALFRQYYETGNRYNYERPYFENRRRLNSFVISYLYEKDEELLKLIENDLFKVCNEYSWELPAHIKVDKEGVEATGIPPKDIVALFSAETAMFLSEMKLLLRDDLNPFIVQLIEDEIEKRIFFPFEKYDFWWEQATFNWSSVCGGSIGVAAIINIKDRQRVSRILNCVIKTMDFYLDGFDEQGNNPEGVSYWEYGFGFYVYFAKWLGFYTQNAVNLLQGDKIESIAKFPAALSHYNGVAIPFSDCPDREVGPINNPLLCILESDLGIKAGPRDYTQSPFFDHTHKFARVIRTYLYANLNEDLSSETPQKEVYFKDTQVFIFKNFEPSYRCFAIKGGSNGESHNHNDLGSFLLRDDKIDILADLGAGEYTKEYFQADTRYSYVVNRGKYHNIPIIDGFEQKEGPDYFSTVVEHNLEERSMMFDLSHAYPIKDLLFKRLIYLNKDITEIKIVDSFDKKRTIEETFITKYIPLISKDKLVISTETSSWEITSPNVEITTEEVPYSDHFGVAKIAYRTVFKLQTDNVTYNIKKIS